MDKTPDVNYSSLKIKYNLSLEEISSPLDVNYGNLKVNYNLIASYAFVVPDANYSSLKVKYNKQVYSYLSRKM